jgi:hypothetical protein
MTAAAAKARWYPDTRAATAAPADAPAPNPCSRLVVWLAASVERIASPSDPPTYWAVLNRPDASPASSRETPPVPSSVIGTNVSPIPMLIGSSPISRLPT